MGQQKEEKISKKLLCFRSIYGKIYYVHEDDEKRLLNFQLMNYERVREMDKLEE